jgi:ketosteroid isomerase-like protein
MSQENVEMVRASIDAMNRGDMNAAFKEVAPDARADQSRAAGLDRSVYSVDQFRRLAEEFASSWESVRYETDEFIEAGEHVVTPFTTHLRGRDGIEVQARATWIWTIRDGAIVRLSLYQELEEALEAAGLRE